MAGAQLAAAAFTITPMERNLKRVFGASAILFILSNLPEARTGLGFLPLASAITIVYISLVLWRYQKTRKARAATNRPPPTVEPLNVWMMSALLLLYTLGAALCLLTTILSFEDLMWIDCHMYRSKELVCSGLGDLLLVITENVLAMASVAMLAHVLWSLCGSGHQAGIELPVDFDETDLERGYRPCNACGQVVYVPMGPPNHHSVSMLFA